MVMQVLCVVLLYVFSGVNQGQPFTQTITLRQKLTSSLSCSLSRYDTLTHIYIQLISVCSVCMAKTMGHLAAQSDTGQWFDFGCH